MLNIKTICGGVLKLLNKMKVNIWCYNQNEKHKNLCTICQTYTKLSIKALREKWQEDWGDLDYLVQKIIEGNRQYIDLGKYSNETKHEIIDFIKKYNKKN